MTDPRTPATAADPSTGLPPLPLPAAAGGAPARAEARLRHLLGRLRRLEDRRTLRRVGLVAAAVLALGTGTWAAIEFWPRPAPDFLDDPMDQVLDYTLLTGDFNRLPLDQRLGLIKDLITRLKTMSAQDSLLMAQFATRLKEEARRQLEENAKKLAVDMLDSYAQGYKDVPPESRSDYLDQKAIEFTKLMEDLAGERSGLPADDGERLAALKRQAKRDEEMLARGDRRMRADRVSGFVQFMQKDSDKIASPMQQARMVHFTRDMVRHLRGENVNAPQPPPAGGAEPDPPASDPPDDGGP